MASSLQLPTSCSASSLPQVTPVSQRLLLGARIGVVIGGETPEGKACIERLLSTAGDDWLLKVSPPPSSSTELPVLPFPELSVELWGKDDKKWREEEENIVGAMRGAFGVYVASSPLLKRNDCDSPSSKIEDTEMEVRMAQRLGRCAQLSGVHHFVFSGKDIRSEACVMTLHPRIQSVLFLRVDTFLEELANLQEDIQTNQEEMIALISAKDLGHLAAKSFTDPQQFELPGKVNIYPVSAEIISKRRLLERLHGQLLENATLEIPLISSQNDLKLRSGLATTLQLLPSADNLSNWVGSERR